MMIKPRLWLASLVVACTVMPVTANAALVEWSFSAVVREIDGNVDGMAELSIAEGTVMTATYTLDASVMGTPITGNVWYNEAIVGLELNAGSINASVHTLTTTLNTIIVLDGDFDGISVLTRLDLDNPGVGATALAALEFVDSDGQLIDSDMFPAFPDFAQANPFASSGLASYFLFSASVDGIQTAVWVEVFNPTARIVPLPAAFYLLGTGLVALWGVRRRG